ncbi:MAG: hypothetical protein KA419_18915 [Acidobacteria bacterium]|nr:hypothetical protein [Acidobacteriota bacterium]
MGPQRLLPDSYEDLAAELGPATAAFDALFQEAIRYFDSLLGQDAKSTPALEKSYVDRFAALLAAEGFLQPKNIREALIKLSYGYYMKTRS